jgi:lipopolysaccharide transport system ATP-binding protein
MYVVEKLCHRIVVLDSGRISGTYTDVRQGIMAYLGAAEDSKVNTRWFNSGRECQNGYFVPTSLVVSSGNPDALIVGPLSNLDPILIRIEGEVRQTDPSLSVGVAVYTEEGEPIFWSFMNDTEEDNWPLLPQGNVRLSTILPPHLLNEGIYRVEVIADLRDRYWLHHPRVGTPASVTFAIRGGLSKSPLWNRKRPGLLAPVLPWRNFD